MLAYHRLPAWRINPTMATRTAPTVDGTPLFKLVSFRWMDYTGDKWSQSIPFAPDATAAEIEAVAVVLQAASNATMYGIQVTDDYDSTAIKSNAVEATWENAKDQLVIHYKNVTTRADFRLNVPSVKNELFIEGTDNPDLADVAFTNLLAAFAATVPAGFAPVTVRFSKHRDINQSTPIG